MKRVLVFAMQDSEMQALRKIFTPDKGIELVWCDTQEAFIAPASYQDIDLVLSGNPTLKLNDDYFALLEAAGIQKMVLRMTGVGQVDFTAATRHGVEIANVQNYDPNVIAELAVALAMA